MKTFAPNEAVQPLSTTGELIYPFAGFFSVESGRRVRTLLVRHPAALDIAQPVPAQHGVTLDQLLYPEFE